MIIFEIIGIFLGTLLAGLIMISPFIITVYGRDILRWFIDCVYNIFDSSDHYDSNGDYISRK